MLRSDISMAPRSIPLAGWLCVGKSVIKATTRDVGLIGLAELGYHALHRRADRQLVEPLLEAGDEQHLRLARQLAGSQVEQDALTLEARILICVLEVEARDRVGVVGGLVLVLGDDVQLPCGL